MIAWSVCSTFHEVSFGTGPASINDDPSLSGTARVLNRSRTVRGLTKVTEKGKVGSCSYSVPGNSVDRPRAKVTSILLNESVVLLTYRFHCSAPCPVAGLKSATLLPT